MREKRGLCYSVYAFHWSFSDTGLFGVHAATGQSDIAELMDVVTLELGKVCQDIRTEEVDRARAQFRAGLLMAQESAVGRAGQIARQLMLHGRTIETEETMERLKAITPDRLTDLAGRMFHSGKATLASVGPVKTLLSVNALEQRMAGFKVSGLAAE